MTDLRDGFLYHPDGGSSTRQLKRLLASEHNLALDDLFSTTLDEADEAILKAEKEHAKAVERIARLEDKIKELKEEKIEITSAIHRFEETGEVADVLYPSCEKLLASERQEYASNDAAFKAKEISDAETMVGDVLGTGWSVDDSRADDEFVYVTIKRRRATPPTTPRPTRNTIVERVKQAFDAHAQAFRDRVKPVRLASVTVGRPRAP